MQTSAVQNVANEKSILKTSVQSSGQVPFISEVVGLILATNFCKNSQTKTKVMAVLVSSHSKS